MSFKILSFDGGGAGGIIPINFLCRMEEVEPGFLDSIDMFAGTSTGALIALYLARLADPGEADISMLKKIYQEAVPKIFGNPRARWKRLFWSRYRRNVLEDYCRRLIGDDLIGQFPRKVIVAATPTGNRYNRAGGFIFNNLKRPFYNANLRAHEIALASTAAPTYFPSYRGFVDGGLICNNPSLVAVQMATDPDDGLGIPLEDIRLMSFGTGKLNVGLNGHGELDWGYLKWGPRLVSFLMDSTVRFAHDQCVTMLGNKYFRMNLELPYGWTYDLDSVEAFNDLDVWSNSADIRHAVDWIRKVMLHDANKLF